LKLPRDLSGDELARLLRRHGYEVSRQTGSHMRLTSQSMGTTHHITLPAHRHLRVSTLAGILGEVASYLKTTREALAEQLFKG
jgi:predicted RNA binding protein YcfA (HicA-like mRNA interferase family)